MAGISKEDVIKMMKSVVCVNADLYPNDYDTDRRFYELVVSSRKDKETDSSDNTFVIDVSLNTVLQRIDMEKNLSKFISEFKRNFDPTSGIGSDYDKLISKYSSPEIILLYDLFPDLSYFHISIHLDHDMRPVRKKNVTTLYLPDLQIDTLSIKLRDFLPQSIVDEINKYMVDAVEFSDNVMSKKNAFIANNVNEFFGLMETLCKKLNNEELYKELYSLFSFLDIEEIKTATLILTTDWPVL